MSRAALLLFSQFLILHLSSQKITYSKGYPSIPKNIPLAIINRHANYFYLLRSNQLAHDLTIERRAKPNGEMLSFTPLKLDSINAHWFNYEQLDYLFFEREGRVCFVFEKSVNNRKTIYLKTIDTTGRSSGFSEIADLEREKNITDIYFEWKITEAGLLVIAAREINNGTTRKAAILYDPVKHRVKWTKSLPVEDSEQGQSTRGFNCNKEMDLYYALLRGGISGYERRFINQMQVQVPVVSYDKVSLFCLRNDSVAAPERWDLQIGKITRLNSLLIQPGSNSVKLLLHYTQQSDPDSEERDWFSHTEYSKHLEELISREMYPLSQGLAAQLKFFDGSDYDQAATKKYSLFKEVKMQGYSYQVSERRDQNYFKELVVWKDKPDTATGQFIIPRKIFYYKGSSRYKNLALSTHVSCEGKLFNFVIESRSNFDRPTTPFRYHKFASLSLFGRANAVCYVIAPGGSLTKTLLYRNAEYDYLPLEYDSDQCDYVFYLTRGRLERFAILDLKQL